MAVGFAGLGWMVARQPKIVERAVGQKRIARLWSFYLRFLANSMSGDRDGDGVGDGVELWQGTDPQNSMSHYPLEFASSPRLIVIAFCGEPLAVRWMEGVGGAYTVRWPRGFRVTVSANEAMLRPKNGTGRPTGGALMLSVNERGEVECEILAESMPEYLASVMFRSAVTNEFVGSSAVQVAGWRTVPIPVSIEGAKPEAGIREEVKVGLMPGGGYLLKWDAPTGWMGGYVIEAASEEGVQSWIPLQAMPLPIPGGPVPETTYFISREDWRFFPGYTGPLKFRVVPVSATPP